MRQFSALCILLASAATAAAWQALIGPVCVLTHATDMAEMRLTYDPAKPEYTISVRLRDGAWPDAPRFAMRFVGPQGRTISTDRHVRSEGGASLTVTDTGFGNVLDGLQFNDTAIAMSGDTGLDFPLDGAAPAVAAFRACRPAAGV